jgi:hypothetical protein
VRVVLDANVWVSGLIRPEGPPGRVLDAVRTGRVRAVASWDLASEVVAVLRRPRVRKYLVEEPDVAGLLLLMAPFLPHVDVDLPVRDPKDAPVLAAALAGGAEVIVTGDGDLLDDGKLRALLAEKGIAVESPAAFLRRLGG